MVALGIAIFLELAGGVLFILGSPLGSCLLVCKSGLTGCVKVIVIVC